MQMQASNSPFIGFTQQPPPPDGSVPPTRPHPESRFVRRNPNLT
uniref:Uncharacterized protein n=1 Tax=Rhizophora mucronata TaxID=61149 RepID=A0A2P2MJF5_RHIMU